MKKNILFFTFFVFTMINHLSAQNFKLDPNGTSVIYDVTGQNARYAKDNCVNCNKNDWYIYEKEKKKDDPNSDTWHHGDDQYAQDINRGFGRDDLGQSVYAGIEGTIIGTRKLNETSSGNLLGNRVVILSNDKTFALSYSHLNEFFVEKGNIIKKGDIIGTIGKSSSNPDMDVHLHLALYKNIDLEKGTQKYELSRGNSPTKEYYLEKGTTHAALLSRHKTARISNQEVGPLLSSPSLEQINVSKNVSFVWKPITKAVRYEVFLSKDYNFNLITGFNSVDIIQKTKNTQVILDLEDNTKYYWSVKAFFANGEESMYSPIRKFTTRETSSSIQEKPILLLPSDNQTKTDINSLSFDWEDVSRASEYLFQVSLSSELDKDKGFKKDIIHNKNIAGNNSDYEMIGFDKNKVYYWSVRAKIGNDYSEFSLPRKFTTQNFDTTVKLTFPFSNQENVDLEYLKLDWEYFPNTMFYNVVVSTDPDFNNTSGFINKNARVSYESVKNGLTNSFPKELQGNTKYYWSVKPVINGKTVPFAPIRSFTTGEDTKPNILPKSIQILELDSDSEITEANIGEHIRVKLDVEVIQKYFEGIGSYVDFCISKDAKLDSRDINIGRHYVNITPESNPKSTATRLRLPGYIPNGDVYLIAKVDSQKVHQESNENDNIISIPIKLNKEKDFIITQSASTIKVEFYAPHSMKLKVVMISSGYRPFSRTLYGWHKTVHASRCIQNTPIQFSRTGEVTISLYQVISKYNSPLFGRVTDTLIPIDSNCNEIISSSARQSTITSKTSLDVPTPELLEVQVVNLFNPTNPIKKLVDKTSFDIKSLNLPSGFYAIRFADGESKKVYLK